MRDVVVLTKNRQRPLLGFTARLFPDYFGDFASETSVFWPHGSHQPHVQTQLAAVCYLACSSPTFTTWRGRYFPLEVGEWNSSERRLDRASLIGLAARQDSVENQETIASEG